MSQIMQSQVGRFIYFDTDVSAHRLCFVEVFGISGASGPSVKSLCFDRLINKDDTEVVAL